ncbi:MAG: alginate lyase family protein [Prevotella sp.]|nr:alginate lyase family protein [Prevotella sp.]
MNKILSLFCLLAIFLPNMAQTSSYKMAGPYEVIARDGKYANTKGGSERDMKAALDFALKGNNAEARNIIDAYVGTLKRLEGHDAPLCAIQCYWLVRAMIMVRPSEPVKGDEMLRRAMLPMMEQFEADSPYANGNWGAIVNRLRMACAICLKDSALYRASVDYFMDANDNGSLPRYISETGQCQETGRDQQHAQLGLGALCDLCEMAWEQGDDLYGALDNRLMKGLEYTARYNLGYDVPFETWHDCTGLYCDWTEPGMMGRGRIRDIYRAAYHHYVERRGLQMPYTKRLLALQKKAEKAGEVKKNIEADEFTVKGVKEGQKLHQVFTYQAPDGAPLKHDYDVFIRPRSSQEWIRIDTYMAKVNAPVENGKHRVSEISYGMFDFTGDVFVRVVTKNRKYTTARVRPAYRGVITNEINDSTIQFLLFQPENVSVEFDGDITNNLLLFTSKPPVSQQQAEMDAKRQGREFVCYTPGFYPNDTIRVGSNTTVYLCGGTYFTGTFAIEDAENVSILGRGIARPKSGYEGCHVHRSKNVLIDGLVVNTCPVGESDGVKIHDVRSISHPGWGDGLNVFASSNVVYDRVFCRNSDDCTTAYATRKGFGGNARNITMRNSTLWADVAHPIFIGIHGNAERGDTIENLRYENVDILGQAEPQVDYQGCMAINCGDNNLVRNVVFDNIRVEQIKQGCLVQVKVGFNQKYCAAPGRGVENVCFRNIRYRGELPQSLSIISGYDDQRLVRDVTFENLKINGWLLHDQMKDKPSWYATADFMPMFVGPHVVNLKFSKVE